MDLRRVYFEFQVLGASVIGGQSRPAALIGSATRHVECIAFNYQISMDA